MPPILPLCQVPLLPLEMIIKNWKFYELFHFSVCSSKCRQLVRLLKPLKFRLLVICFGDNRNSFFLCTQTSHFTISICPSIPRSEDTEVNAFDSLLFWNKKKKKPSPVFRNFTFRFGGHKFPLFTILEDGKEVISLVEDSEGRRRELFCALFDFLTTTFHLDHHFQIDNFSKKHTESALEFMLHRKWTNLRLSDGAFSHEQLTKFLDNVAVDTFQFDVYPIGLQSLRTFHYPRQLKFDRMSIQSGQWIRYHHIEHLSFVSLHANHTNLTTEDVDNLIGKWMLGGCDQLEEIHLGDLTNWDEGRVLEWMLDSKERRRLRRRGVVVTRDDGRMATVTATRTEFSFRVCTVENDGLAMLPGRRDISRD